MSRRILLIIFLLIVAGLFNFRSAYAKGDIQWDMQELFGHKSQNEDITKILRQISKRNKMKLVILPGVQGTVTFDFVHFPLQGVFNLIITKHDLDYRYDKSTNTLTVSNRGDPMLRAGSSDAPTKPEPEPSSAVDVAIKTVERELDEMIQKEQLATRMAETQILKFKELEAQKRVVYLAEANVNRLFQSGASLQEQISAAEEAKKKAKNYLALQAKHEEELEKLRVERIPSEPRLKAKIFKPPPVGAEFISGKRAAIKTESVEHKLASQRKLKALDERIKVLTATRKKDKIAVKRRRKEQKERIAEITKTSERLDRELNEARLKLEASVRNQTQKISEMQEQVSTQGNLRTEAELKERLAKGKLEREQLQFAYSMNETNESIAQIKRKAKIREQQHANRVAGLRAERKKIYNSQKRLAAELRLKEKQWAKSELELQTTLKQVRQSQKQASLKNDIKIQKQENREQELEAKLEQMRQSQKQTQLQGMIDAEKNAKRERELQIKLEEMQHAQAQAKLQARLDAERQLQIEQELQLKLERMRHAQAQAELKANIEVEKKTQRERKLEAKLEQSRREKVAAEMEVAKEINLKARHKAEADELREIAENEKMEKQKLEAEKLRMLSELAAHKQELERLKRKKPTKDELKLVRKLEPDSQTISANSFESLAGAKKPIDATWLYKLTGIGRSAGSLYATVDGKDYKIGDRFAGLKIVQIERDKVLCIKQTKDGLIPYVVGFRRR